LAWVKDAPWVCDFDTWGWAVVIQLARDEFLVYWHMSFEMNLRRTVMEGLLVMAGFGGICQGGNGVVKKGMCPFRGGVIKKYEQRYYYGDRNPGETIIGRDSLVISTRDGIVEAQFTVGDLKVVMIRKGIIFYTYVNLDTVFVAKGKSVRRGDVIGLCLRKELDFVISDTSGNNRWPAKYLDCEVKLIKQK
jgi:hypothetical protein